MDKMLIFHVLAGLQMCCQNENFVNTLPNIIKSVKTATLFTKASNEGQRCYLLTVYISRKSI